MKRVALLIIDMQNDFVLEGRLLKVAQGRAVVPKIKEVLNLFRSKNLPVFHIIRVHRSNGSDVEINRQELFKKHPFAVAGSPGAAIVDELSPLPHEFVIPKIRMSAFLGTDLDLILRNLGISELIVTGIQTPNCIRTTVFDAVAHNYPVILIEDAVGAQNDEIHHSNVRDMINIGVRVMDTREINSALEDKIG